MVLCAIGYFTKDNTIRAVLCENDGYIDGVGFMLIKHYSDSWETVESLVDQGYIVNLNETLEDTDFDVDSPIVNEYDTERDYIEHAAEMGCDYIYLFLEELDIGQPPMWNVARSNTDFVPIVDRMMQSEEGYLQGVA